MPWTIVQLEVTTPLFNHGAGDDAGVRVPSLRGVMRYWFRAFAGIVVGNDLECLSKLERHVFGATDRASPVKMCIPKQPQVSERGRPGWCRGEDGRSIVYLLGQGLSNSEGIRRHLEPGETVELQLRLGDDEDIASLVLAALWLTCTYGGLGARTRRGFGGLSITDIEGDLPKPWTAETIRTPGLDGYTGTWPQPDGPLEGCRVGPLADVLRKVDRDGSLPFAKVRPSYPAMVTGHIAGGLSKEELPSWSAVLSYAGWQLRHFRASKPNPGAGYKPPVKTPEWTNVVHGSDNDFPVGALGLPVGYGKQYEFNAYDGRGETIRRASPLWLRAVGADNHWKLFSFAFRSEFLPPRARVELRGRGRPRTVVVRQEDVTDLTDAWINELATGTDFSSAPHCRENLMQKARKRRSGSASP